ncbi:hypothetical protein AY601_1997 [Pedobacter cryoconitis]|uniref:Uncharacterized protein n=1 Tax=Pedobacter cryoconitis TaxID=188932 RepID=A0A127VC27_9SPHI|nr:hypothetical protein [Pedobacter cryoconitis]AMP98903.1 hypothetical protein AY601_1997 [Pedobacter cryoconitis]
MNIDRRKLPIYTIQENGLISDPKWADGRLIPYVVLNNYQNGEELKDFLKAHNTSINQGDVTTQWASPLLQYFKPKNWLLLVKFAKPREFEFYIEFSLEKNPALIDAIFQSRGLNILYGFPGDKISNRADQYIVLMEVPNLNQDERWNKILREILKTKFKKQNMPKKQISIEVEKQIRKMRELLHFRK